MDEITYRNARASDAKALAGLFADTFSEIFGHLYRPEDLTTFLAENTPRHFAAQIEDPAFAVRLAERDCQILGYTKLGPLKLPVDPGGPAIELRQLYLVPEARGTSVSGMLIDWTYAEAASRGARTLYLSVFTENHRARAFYARQGFREIGPYAFMVGEQADEDIILARDL